MTLSGTITTEMRFISLYTLSCCAMDIDTSSTVTPKEFTLMSYSCLQLLLLYVQIKQITDCYKDFFISGILNLYVP